ncbi:MAG: transposase [Piscirickettsiaceae bacterium]|nr:transposase [Piscirickettsiaceae bacterium]
MGGKLHYRVILFQPGNPQKNAYIERFNRTVRYDWLSHTEQHNGYGLITMNDLFKN